MSAALAQPVISSLPATTHPFVVVATSDRDDWAAMRMVLSDGGYGLVRAVNSRELERALRELPVAVVVCESEPFGRDWREIARRLEGEDRRPMLIVCSQHADEQMWLDVLDRGGFDVFAKPLPTRLFRDRVEAAIADWLWLR